MFYHFKTVSYMYKVIMLICGVLLLQSCMNLEKRKEQCNFIGEFHNGFAICSQDDKYFMIDEEGQQRTDEFDMIYDFKHGYAVAYKVVRSGRGTLEDMREFYFLDKNLKVVKPNITIIGCAESVNSYGQVWANSSGKRDEWGVFDINKNNYISDFIGYPQWIAEDGTAVLSRGVRDPYISMTYVDYYEHALYDRNGNAIIPFGKFTYISDFSKGLACYSSKKKYKYEKHSTVIPCEKSKKRGAGLGIETVVRFGYINIKGEILTTEKYTFAGSFNEQGYAKVSQGWTNYDMKNFIIDVNMKDCTNNPIAIASFYGDDVWETYKDKSGNCCAVNNKGNIVSLGSAVDVGNVEKLIMTKKGTVYKLYEIIDGNLKQLAEIKRERSDEVVLYVKNSKARETETIGFLTPNSRKMSFFGYCSEYRLDGGFVRTDWLDVYGLENKYRYSQFIFK